MEYEKIDKYKGYQYAIWFNDREGYRCGYVKIPEDHKLYKEFYRDINLNTVPLTFGGKLRSLDGWYIGWDHHHLWDGIDEEGIRKLHSNEENIEELIEFARSMAGDPYGPVSTCDDVEIECQNVIDELLNM